MYNEPRSSWCALLQTILTGNPDFIPEMAWREKDCGQMSTMINSNDSSLSVLQSGRHSSQSGSIDLLILRSRPLDFLTYPTGNDSIPAWSFKIVLPLNIRNLLGEFKPNASLALYIYSLILWICYTSFHLRFHYCTANRKYGFKKLGNSGIIQRESLPWSQVIFR